MNRRSFLKLSTLAGGSILAPDLTNAQKSLTRPNILFILVDDFGWKDVGYNGSTFYETPRIDEFALKCMKFNYCYTASPMCSPTRVSIMTGKAPARHGVTQWLPGDKKNKKNKYNCPITFQYMKKEETTLGEAFQEAGYETAFMGKWHMGAFKKNGYPRDHGFNYESSLIEINNCTMPFPFKRKTKGKYPVIDNTKKGDYFTDKLTDNAIDFIVKKKEKPFFLYLSHFAMHYPIESKPDLKKTFEKKRIQMGLNSKPISDAYSSIGLDAAQYSSEYAGELANLDENIGRLLSKLKETGQYENTIIVFTGDNGGRISLNKDNPTSIAPLRGGKTFLFEGGLRTPLLIHWSGKTKPDSISDTKVTSMDFYPTLLEMADLPLKPEQHLDGVSLVPLIHGKKINRDTLYWHFPHYQPEGGYPASSIIENNYKLIINYHFNDVLLFNIEKDPFEKNNLALERPEKVQYLKKKFDLYLKNKGGEIPRLH